MQSQTLKRSISRSPSAWYSPPFPHHHNPILTTLSHAISNSPTKPLHVSLSKLLPSLTPSHVVDLIVLNPFSLSPHSLFSFFNFLSSHPTFRHTLHSYSAMSHFLVAHNMLPQARFLLNFLVSRKGKDSASSIFASVLETKGTYQCDFVFDSLMIAYTDLGFVSDAIQCFRLVRKHKLRVPFRGCKYLFDRMMKISSPIVSLGFYMEILDYGFPPNVYSFNILMNKLCREGLIKDAQMVFDEIASRGLHASVVSFNTLINGYCKSGNLDEGFRLRSAMEEAGIRPDVFTYSVLINGLCKESRLDKANELFEEMCN
ncbi:hypothetical protein ES288_A08G047000v1 [Gossypium darwinii]|uniref:Pentacotripeptide-repeat region of PRORP domain-containing protein n=1 Tax=Gossypium darwinii TaxID=34276 RepID=A0A5D2FI09_GOSDA|nr:hypothetical protein ES288_A08G047000v1 [Gossypium darwinii]